MIESTPMSNTTNTSPAHAIGSDAETPFARSKGALFALGDRIVRLAQERGAAVAEAVISEGSHLSRRRFVSVHLSSSRKPARARLACA